MFANWMDIVIEHKRMCKMSMTQPHSVVTCLISSSFEFMPFNICKDWVNFIKLVFGRIPEFLKKLINISFNFLF